MQLGADSHCNAQSKKPWMLHNWATIIWTNINRSPIAPPTVSPCSWTTHLTQLYRTHEHNLIRPSDIVVGGLRFSVILSIFFFFSSATSRAHRMELNQNRSRKWIQQQQFLVRREKFSRPMQHSSIWAIFHCTCAVSTMFQLPFWNLTSYLN